MDEYVKINSKKNEKYLVLSDDVIDKLYSESEQKYINTDMKDIIYKQYFGNDILNLPDPPHMDDILNCGDSLNTNCYNRIDK